MNGPVYALLVHDDGTGPQLYAGGSFTPSPGQPGGGLARWNGVSWSAVGGSFGGATSPAVCALAVHDDGTGPALFAGGAFTTAGGVAASGVARWDGASWSALGSGVVPPPTILANFAPGWVLTLTSFDADGAGPLPAAALRRRTVQHGRRSGRAQRRALERRRPGAAWAPGSTTRATSWAARSVR